MGKSCCLVECKYVRVLLTSEGRVRQERNRWTGEVSVVMMLVSPTEELEEVSQEKEVCSYLLRLLPPRPRVTSVRRQMNGWMGIINI